MSKKTNTIIKINQNEINITGITDDDYISLTDIARLKNNDTFAVINNWMRKVDTLEFLKLWESINNESFKPLYFERFKSKPGENAFVISPKQWVELIMRKYTLFSNQRIRKRFKEYLFKN